MGSSGKQQTIYNPLTNYLLDCGYLKEHIVAIQLLAKSIFTLHATGDKDDNTRTFNGFVDIVKKHIFQFGEVICKILKKAHFSYKLMAVVPFLYRK